jgi:serine protease AprX
LNTASSKRLPSASAARRGAAWALALAALAGSAAAGELDPSLAALANLAPRSSAAVVIELEGMRPLEDYAAQLAPLPRAARPGRLAALLRKDYEAAAAPVLAELQGVGAWGVQGLWISHSIAVHVAHGKLAQIAELPSVKRIDSDASLRSAASRQAPAAGSTARRGPPAAAPVPAAAPAPANDSLEALRLGRVLQLPPHFLSLDVLSAWQRGHAGQGVTVAVVDSGVDLRASSIAARYRGGAADWFDPYAQRQLPSDATGHGTLVAGLLVGGMVDDTPIGVAPRAMWIAARLFDDAGQGRASAVQRIYQWLLDPDGDPATPDAPDIVNNSWGLPQSAGRCDLSFARALGALQAADIHVVFAAGNDGPLPGTSMSPANNPGVLSVGALNADRSVAQRSSRGPSGCGGGPFPSLHAPGVNLPALDRIAAATGSAAVADGTSFAAAAVSGALAVLRSAAPLLSRAEVEALLLKHTLRDSSPADGPIHSPSLRHSLAALGAASAAGSAPASSAPAALRWNPGVEAGQAIPISADALSGALPWSLRAASIELVAPPVSGTFESQVGGLARLFGAAPLWHYTPDAAKPAPLRLKVRADDGRELLVEVAPQYAQATATRAPRQRQSVQTAANRSVEVALAAELRAATGLRLTTPLRGGRVKNLGDGRIEYTPPMNFVGTDQFTVASAGALGADAPVTTVLVQVLPQ